MGGTSTDVTHYAGAFERAFDTEVAGVRIRAPMMKIHTVAAGGGSIISFDGQRFRVGPESAGANPGPACYRRGGPLAVTDANLMVGKLLPDFFPHVFGPSADQPLDAEVVRAAFAALAHEVAKSTGIERTPEELAQGCLAIANDNMANAIKEISVQRGIDVTKGYALCCFGGAGAQHACQVADLLGIGRVFIHPYASVLSAYGMGLADMRVLRQEAVEKPLDAGAGGRARADRGGPRRGGARRSCSAQEVEDARIALEPRAHVRYAGTDTSLEVPLADARRDARRLRGRAPHPLRLRRRGPRPRGRGGHRRGHRRHGGGGPSRSSRSPRASTRWSRCSPRRCSPTARRTSRPSGSRPRSIRARRCGRATGSPGPALVCGATTTVVVEPGWALEVTPRDHLMLDRVEPLARAVAVGTHCDPILLEIFNNLFMTIAEQMGVTLQSTAYSVNVKERLDFSCAVFAADGALVANAPHMPVHLGSMGQSVRTILELNRDRLRPGDVWALNNPYNGGTHLPDITVVMPVFEGGGARLLHRLARAPRRCRRHHPGLDAARQHAPSTRRACCSTISSWSRTASCARRRCSSSCAPGPGPCATRPRTWPTCRRRSRACQRGANELAKMVAQFGLATVRAYMGHVQDNAEESVRRVLDVLQDGEFTYAARRRAGGEGADLDRQGGAPRQGRLHRHQRAAALELQRPGRRDPRRRALRLPHAGRRRHPDERGLPEADRHRPARGLDRLPAATRPRSAPAMSRPRSGSPTRSTAPWASSPPRRAR